MRRLLTALLFLTILIALPIAVQAQAVAEGNVWIFGLRYDDHAVGTFGAGVNISGNLWEFTYADFGQTAAVNFETVYLIEIPESKFYFGPILGPNVHWENKIGDGENPVAYIVGATGMAGSYSFSPKVGVWAYYKDKFALKKGSAFEDRWVAGIGIHIKI